MGDEPSRELIDTIRQFVAERTGHELHDITGDTTLYGDLGVYGDDAHEILIVFAKKFRVSFEGFWWPDYFESEGPDFLAPIVTGLLRLASGRFRRTWRAAKKREREITIRHLAQCAAVCRCIPSEIPRRTRPMNGRRLVWLIMTITFAPFFFVAVLLFPLIGIAGLNMFATGTNGFSSSIKAITLTALGFGVGSLYAFRTITEIRDKVRGPRPVA